MQLMEPQTLAEFFSHFSGTVWQEIAKPKKRKKTIRPPLHNQLCHRLDMPKQNLRKPNPKTLVKLRLMLKYQTQREIAQSVGVSPTTLSHYTNDRGKVGGWNELDAKIESYILLNIHRVLNPQ